MASYSETQKQNIKMRMYNRLNAPLLPAKPPSNSKEIHSTTPTLASLLLESAPHFSVNICYLCKGRPHFFFPSCLHPLSLILPPHIQGSPIFLNAPPECS